MVLSDSCFSLGSEFESGEEEDECVCVDAFDAGCCVMGGGVCRGAGGTVEVGAGVVSCFVADLAADVDAGFFLGLIFPASCL
jgi:hypothetical protein